MFKHPLKKLITWAGAAAVIYYFLEKSKQQMAQQPVKTKDSEVVIDVESKPK